MKAIKEMMNKNQPYIGCFLFKNENAEGDTIKSKDEVYETGVLAQVTSTVFSRDVETGNEILTTVFYVHKRIKIDELFAPKEVKDYEQDTSAAHDQPEEIVVRSQKEKKEIIDGITGEKEGDTPSSTERNRIVDADEEKQISPQTKPMITKQDVDAAIEDEQENPTAYLKKYPITLVNVSNVEDLPYDKKSPMINALTAEILQVFKDISSMNKVFSDQMATFSSSLQKDVFQSPEKLADFAASLSAAEEKDLQEILECVDVEKRLELALVVLNKELMNKKLQKDIEKDLEERMTKRHREYHLNEQLKSIKKELGIDDGRDKLIAKYNERVKDLKMPEDVKKVYDDEINKLSSLEPLMSEFTVTRNYLDWLTQIPWGKASKDEYSIRRAVRILNEDHYGLKDVKERILEFIAVGKLLNKINGKIICFVGPPGVGKTSIGKSIAEALNRKFYRFSVGGLSDVSEIKGHRRTYVGAIPGRVVQALKKTQTENPLILIDEIDKVSHTHSVNGGDPAAALLELLDPEQNNSFLDNYMDVPIDLSKVLFVCTANTLSTIPGPLLDRMEVIEISGYIAEEKIKIAEKYLAPDAKKSSGLDKVNVNLTEEAIKALIKNYCRESGVRNLKKQIEKIYRKAALNVVKELGDEEEHKKDNNEISTSETEPKDTTKTKTASKNSEETHDEKQARNLDTTPKPEDEVEAEIPQINVPESYKVEVDEKNLKDYVGPQIYTADRLYETTPPGVVMGLAWTSMGGSALYIESVLEQAITIDSVPRVEITGQLGDVMKESSRIAYSFAEMFLAKNYPGNRFFEKAKIHLHCPEGATPKDGPSAGVTMTSSFLSLALNKSLDPTVAMTGELTLTGKVLRIGGLKEKTIAAKRSGVKTIIFPKDNLADWKELPDNVKEGLTPVAADWYSDVFNVLFPDLSKEDANNVWKAEFDKIEEEKNKKNDNK
ncbi:hypothetical protein PACTADRAFT_59584 [Pachysolen tannophilus NRRL Y-2460]|uniref:Lon protease homolog, mitochondrial n=1 Tax=Pachysolen tannophilus NRRL Y-2460 TaxID=669874 RepID=A0A1E4TT78_PACTA|nr:hypothetical protein PACTADRAFT_59584 [Pachysolen tannophilus NRRL Y-2460]